MVSVAAEQVHKASGAGAGRVAITGRGSLAFHEASVLDDLVGGSLVALDLGQQLAVNIERIVRVLDDESVAHGDARRGAQTLLTFGGFRRVLLGGHLFRHQRVHLLGGRAGQTVGGQGLAALQGRLILGAKARGLIPDFLVGAAHLFVEAALGAELLGLEVKHDKVVELLGQLKDAAEDVHLAAVDNGRVTATGRRLVVIRALLDLAPHVAGHVVAPNVVELLVVVLLTAEQVNLLLVQTHGE